jgi:hypothetical protein
MMTGTAPLPADILKRKLSCVRQSSQSQVMNNLENKRRRYDLVDVARERGLLDVEVIDDDLGRWASGTVARSGFDRLVAALCAARPRSQPVYRRDKPNLMMGLPRYMTFGDPRVDAAVVGELMQGVEPMAIEAVFEAERLHRNLDGSSCVVSKAGSWNPRYQSAEKDGDGSICGLRSQAMGEARRSGSDICSYLTGRCAAS